MNSILLAVNDGIVNNNWDEADVSFLAAVILGALAAIAYAAGVGTVSHPEEAPGRTEGTTTTTPVGPAVNPTTRTWTTWHYRAHEIAAALLSLAVTAVALGLFLQ
jgi:hypothetical protein